MILPLQQKGPITGFYTIMNEGLEDFNNIYFEDIDYKFPVKLENLFYFRKIFRRILILISTFRHGLNRDCHMARCLNPFK